jgi:hypothetical protein
MKVDIALFNSVDTHGRAVLLWDHGEFITSRSYYGYKVNLYTMPGFYVELYYREDTNQIEKIEALNTSTELNKFLVEINFHELYKDNGF